MTKKTAKTLAVFLDGLKALALCLLQFVVRAQHIHDLVDVELLHIVAGRAEVLAGVELGGFLGEGLADGGGHGQAAVRVDVDLADGALGGLAELLLGDAHGGFQATTIGVDGVNFLLRHR